MYAHPDPADVSDLSDVPCRAFGSDPADVRIVPLVWICNPDPLSIRICNPPGSNVLNQNRTVPTPFTYKKVIRTEKNTKCAIDDNSFYPSDADEERDISHSTMNTITMKPRRRA